MKTWNTPEMEELSLNMTAGGGTSITTHDGVIFSIDGHPVEEYKS